MAGDSDSEKEDQPLNGNSTLQKRAILLDAVEKLPYFSQNSITFNFSDFLEKFVEIADFLGWDENEKKFAIRKKLTGQAHEFLKYQKIAELSYEGLIKLLKTKFECAESSASALQKFLNFRQTKGMSVTEFFNRAENLSHTAIDLTGLERDPAEKNRLNLLKSMLLGNLLPEIRRGVVSSEPEDVQDVLKYALAEERGLKAIKDWENIGEVPNQLEGNQLACAVREVRSRDPSPALRKRVTLEVEEVKILKDKIKELEEKLDKMAVNKTQQNGNFTCYACGKRGHISKFCTSRRRGGTYDSRGSGGNYEKSYENRGSGRRNYEGTYENRDARRRDEENYGSRNSRGRYRENYDYRDSGKRDEGEYANRDPGEPSREEYRASRQEYSRGRNFERGGFRGRGNGGGGYRGNGRGRYTRSPSFSEDRSNLN